MIAESFMVYLLKAITVAGGQLAEPIASSQHPLPKSRLNLRDRKSKGMMLMCEIVSTTWEKTNELIDGSAIPVHFY